MPETQEIPYGYCHCGCGQKTVIAKETRANRGTIKGTPVHFCKGHTNRRPVKDRFLEKINKTDTCWLWLGEPDDRGYGVISDLGQRIKAHRFSWIFHNGPIPAGLCVLHKCDNPPCVNPDHLFLGTKGDNIQDCKAKGRTARGESHGSARLTSEQVIAIRNSFPAIPKCRLARIYGVTETHIREIINREKWAHIP